MNFNNLSFKEKREVVADLYYRGIDPRSVDYLYSQDEVDEYIDSITRDCAEDDYDRILKDLERNYGSYTTGLILVDKERFISRVSLYNEADEECFGFVMVGNYYVQE